MYESHWKVKEKPFENNLDTNYFVDIQQHKEALNRIVFAAAENKSLVLLLGKHGLGKSFVARVAGDKLRNQGHTVGTISYPLQTRGDFLSQVASSLGLDSHNQPQHRVLAKLHDHLSGVERSGGRATLFVDSVDTISDRALLSELRKLLDLTTSHGRQLLTIVLIAHPNFREAFCQEPGLAQRLDVVAHLTALGEDETKTYLLQRIRLANGPRHMFGNDAIQLIHRASAGVPRVINRICDFALVIGTMQARTQVDSELAEQAIEETNSLTTPARSRARTVETELPNLSSSSSSTSSTRSAVSEDRGDRRRGRRDRDDYRRDRDRDSSRETTSSDDSDNSDSRDSRETRDYRDNRRGRGRDRDSRRDRDNDRDNRRGRGRGRDRDSDNRRGRGRDRDRDNDRDNRRGRGRDRDRDRETSRETSRDTEPLVFNREDHLDIPSMDDLIQNDLKVSPSKQRRGGRSKSQDDVVQYFEARSSDEPAKETADAPAPKKETEESKTAETTESRSGREGRGRGRREGRGRDGRGSRGSRDGGRDGRRGRGRDRDRDSDRRGGRSGGRSSGRSGGRRRDPVEAVIANNQNVTPAPATATMAGEDLAAFGEGLVEVNAEQRQAQLDAYNKQLEDLRKARSKRGEQLQSLAAAADSRVEDEGGFATGLLDIAEPELPKEEVIAEAEAPKEESAPAKSEEKPEAAEESEAPKAEAKKEPQAEEAAVEAEASDEKAPEAKVEASSEQSEESETKEEAPKKAPAKRRGARTRKKTEKDDSEKPKKRAKKPVKRTRTRKKADESKEAAQSEQSDEVAVSSSEQES